MRLAQPPPARLAIPLPTASLLTDSAALAWSKSLAEALLAQDLPASRDASRPGGLAPDPDGGGAEMVPWCRPIPSPTRPATRHGRKSGRPRSPPAIGRPGQPETLKAAADAEAPKVIALLNGIEAHRQMSDPHSLLNRPPVVLLQGRHRRTRRRQHSAGPADDHQSAQSRRRGAGYRRRRRFLGGWRGEDRARAPATPRGSKSSGSSSMIKARNAAGSCN